MNLSADGFSSLKQPIFGIKTSIIDCCISHEEELSERATARSESKKEAGIMVETMVVNYGADNWKRLHLFVYSLSGRAKDWLNALPSGVIATWDDLKKSFLHRFYPTVKYLEKKERDS